MTQFEQNYHRRVGKASLLILAAHVPLMAVTALVCGTSVGLAVGAGLLIFAGPALLQWLRPGSALGASAIAAAAMGFSALLIHLGKGMIEMHFHIFVALACLVALARIVPVLVATATGPPITSCSGPCSRKACSTTRRRSASCCSMRPSSWPRRGCWSSWHACSTG